MSGAMPGEIIAAGAHRCRAPRRLPRCRLAPMPSFVGGRRIDLDPAAPHRRRQRIGHLLQPRQMRQRSIEERARGIRQQMKRILLRRRRRTAARRRPASGPTGRRRCGDRDGRRKRSPPSALLLRVRPRVSARGRGRERHERRGQHFIERLPRQLRAASQAGAPTSSSTSGVARVWCSGFITGGATPTTAIVEPGFGHGLGPRFEERVIGQDQIRQHARLVQEAAEADDERDLLRAPRAPSRPAAP